MRRGILFLACWLLALCVGGAAPVGFSRGAAPGQSSSSAAASRHRPLQGSGSRPCLHAGDEVNSVAARAYLAGHVLVGKARSRSRPSEPGGRYAVTFVVVRSLRGSLLTRGAQVRLPFRDGSSSPSPQPTSPCRQSYNFTTKDFVRADIKRGGKYLVFLTGHGPLNFKLLGEPVISKRKNVQAVRDVLCKNCRREVGVTGLKDMEVKIGGRLRLVCKSRGNPLPALAWYKDGKPLTVSKRVRILYKRKRTSVEMSQVKPEDAGRYECRGTAVSGSRVSSWSTVNVLAPTTPSVTDNTTTLWPLQGAPCPIESYCLNGGTCTYYQTVGELVCQCAEGFKGQRCESKDVYNRSNSSPEDWDRGLPTTRIMTFF